VGTVHNERKPDHTVCIVLATDTALHHIVHAHIEHFKGQSHEIFDPRFFSANNTSWSPDSWAKAVLNINSYSRRYSIFAESTHIREYLREIETKLKNILGH
jgi:hypothetical protein